MKYSVAFPLILALASCPPKPTPPPPTVQTITIAIQPPVSVPCAFTVTSTDAQHPYSATQATNVFTAVPWAVTTATGAAICTGYNAATSPSVGTAGDGKTTITLGPLVPTVAPLPPVPSRDTLANIHACFQGVIATSSDLGTVPSWGPDSWMHPLLADRMATYNAHKAAGCNFITEALGSFGGGYQEAGVAYPNNRASGNFFKDDDYATLCTVTAEIIRNGQFPLIAIGGDNDGPTFDWIHQNFPANFTALKNCKDGDLTPYIPWLLGFDSVDELATNEGANIDDLINFVRSVIGPQAVLVKENQSGWAFWSGAGGGGAGSYNSPAGQNVDVVLQEFDAPPGPPQPAPAIVAGVWDPTHNGYAPVYTDPALGSSFNRIWQVGARTVHVWTRPADEVIDIVVSNCSGGGPNDGGQCHTGSDSANPPCYTCVDTPRGRRYIIGYEYFTYLWVRMKASISDVVGAGSYLTNAGYDKSAGPNSASVASTFSVTAGGGARQTFTVRALTADDRQPHHMVMHKGGALPKRPAGENHIGGRGGH